MFTHSEIWKAIDNLADKHGFSASGLAKKAGLDPTSFNKSKRFNAEGKPRWPSTESIAKVLEVTGTTIHELMASELDPSKTDPTSQQLSQNSIPIMPFSKAQTELVFDRNGFPIGDLWKKMDFIVRETSMRSIIYALEIDSKQFEPTFRKGDIIIVNPGINIRTGDRVLMKTTIGEIAPVEISHKNVSIIELKHLNISHKMSSISAEKVSWLARIIWVSQ